MIFGVHLISLSVAADCNSTTGILVHHGRLMQTVDSICVDMIRVSAGAECTAGGECVHVAEGGVSPRCEGG